MNGYPLTGFYFKLSFPSLSDNSDTSFKEISGLSTEMGIEEIAEGGENRFKHRVPTGAKYQNLVLKRGITSLASPLSDWCKANISGGLSEPLETQTVLLNLLNDKGNTVKSWNFINSWPVKWEFSPLNSMNNEILIETLELAFNYYSVA